MASFDRIWEHLLKGNLPEALQALQPAADGADDSRPAINRALYDPDRESARQRLEQEIPHHLELLATAGRRGRAVILYNLGCFALAEDDILEARIRFSEAVRWDPSYAQAHHNLGYACELMAEFEQSRIHYRRALELNPQQVLSQINLALVEIQMGDFATGAQRLREAFQSDPSNMRLLFLLCRALLSRNREEAAGEVLILLENHPQWHGRQELRECHAAALFLTHNLEWAEQALRDLLQEDPANQFARLGLMKLLALRQDFGDLLPVAEQYQHRSPSTELQRAIEDLRELAASPA